MKVPVLAVEHVRALLQNECARVRAGASRVVESAKEGTLDPEAIHDYRVALRKLRTLLKAAAPLFKRKAMARLQEGLRRFARAAGAVRDEEVLAETLQKITLPEATRARVDTWLAGRARRERELRTEITLQLTPTGDAPREPIVDGAVVSPPAAARRRPMSLSHALTLAQELPLREKAGHVATRALAIQAMERAAKKTAKEAALPNVETPEQLHELRIRWKGVRYTGELLSKAIARSGPLATALSDRVKAATKMQKRLGDMHDLDEAIAAIARARALSAGDRMVVHHRLRTAREALAARLEKELPVALSLLDGGDEGRGLE
ncbi:MAG: CHAD domain-containing protein [Polyangiaceae bacterium]